MRTAIRRAADPLHLRRVPQSFEELADLMAQNPNITATMDGQDSIFMAPVGPPGHRSIIFLSRRVAGMMQSATLRINIVFSDGTFASRPSRPHSRQVFQISTSIHNHVVPLVQVLMQSRTRVAYVAILEALREALPQFRPELVITDFECAQMQAWVQVYDVPVQGCYWHFSRAVSILSRKMGLTYYLGLHPRAKSIVRSLLALPLLPQNRIMEGFMSLAYEAAEEAVYAVLHTFFLKVLDTWLVGFRFQMLSVFLADHRTNNVSESANRMLRLRTQDFILC
ncbi:Carboxy-S-adenosyl-L-methionine synthase [Frankliniella fusca]|uniref:Carboxy-S-adenosyl-L-methionine synthase n=1 Tax=Frankliniella fusca TaxID=407009 RepID=A0AAE1I3N1_9NEOP|nr:Carboxy-S-adenosyl-L-methionine synthase [Frankliniella fusca]